MHTQGFIGMHRAKLHQLGDAIIWEIAVLVCCAIGSTRPHGPPQVFDSLKFAVSVNVNQEHLRITLESVLDASLKCSRDTHAPCDYLRLAHTMASTDCNKRTTTTRIKLHALPAEPAVYDKPKPHARKHTHKMMIMH